MYVYTYILHAYIHTYKIIGTLVVARDIAHAKLKERLDEGKGLPDYVKNHLIYYAGPAKTPQGMASGSFGTCVCVCVQVQARPRPDIGSYF
jgi:hypothetical protein